MYTLLLPCVFGVRDTPVTAIRGSIETILDDEEMPADVRARHFVGTDRTEVAPELRSLVAVERRDLLTDGPPFTQAHLITCRNVLIYFDRATQEALLERFHEALAPGGFLVLGKVEMLLGRTRTLFANVDARARIFRRR